MHYFKATKIFECNVKATQSDGELHGKEEERPVSVFLGYFLIVYLQLIAMHSVMSKSFDVSSIKKVKKKKRCGF